MAAARRLLRRAHRDTDGRFLAEGPQAVREAVRIPPGRPGAADALFATPAALARHADVVALAEAAGTVVTVVTDAGMASLSETVTPQGLVAVCRHLDVPLERVLDDPPRLVAVLVAARDPGNAGTVLRTADAAGAGAVVLPTGSVDPYNGKCVRASAGSLFHLPVVRGGDAAEVLARLRTAGLRVLAATGSGTDDLDDLADSGALAAPTAWVFGNEAQGLPHDVLETADARVRVPLHGSAESLNLAAAAAVCLYASARAHRPAPSVTARHP